MAPLRRTHGRPPGMSSRCQPSATPSLRSVECSGARQNYRCPGQAKRPSKFPLLYCSAWSTPSATPPDATHFGPFGEMLNRSAQIMAGGKSSSGSNLEQLGDELCLGPDVAATYVPSLPFPDHRHRLVARQRSSRCPEAAKAEARIDQSFHFAVILLHDIVQVFHLSQSRPTPQLAISLHLGGRFRIGRVLVHRDGARVDRVRLRQGLAEEPLGRLGVAPGREQEVDRLAAAVDGAIQIHPAALDLHIGVSRPEEFHLQPLAEPDVDLSAHPAPIIPPTTEML